MKAVVCNEFGPPENLVVEDVDEPVPGPGQLLIDVKAAAVTFPDTLMLEDKYQFKTEPAVHPRRRGRRGRGRPRRPASRAGPSATGSSAGSARPAPSPSAGDPCRHRPPAARRRRLRRVTGLNYAYGTTLYGLRYRGDLQPGETLLVLGRRRLRRSVRRRARQADGRPRHRRGVDRREARSVPRARRRRDDQLLDRGSEGPRQGADRRQGRRRGLRLRRRRQSRAGAPGDRVGGPIPRDRLHRPASRRSR